MKHIHQAPVIRTPQGVINHPSSYRLRIATTGEGRGGLKDESRCRRPAGCWVAGVD